MKKTVKVEWCENFIKAYFKKYVPQGCGVYTGSFWKAAEKAGLYERGTYGTPMSEALEKLVNVEFVTDEEGYCLYYLFKLKSC